MDSTEIMQSELNQTTTDLLLQESIQTNQKLDQLQNELILLKDMQNILPESIRNVLFEQLKKLEDVQQSALNQSQEELRKNKELHELQLNDMKSEMLKKIEAYQKTSEIQLGKIRKENQEDMVGKCTKLFDNAKHVITKTVENTTSDFRRATREAERLIGKNLLFSFVTSIVLIAAAFCGLRYVQNYRDGTKIAEAKAVEALANERTRIEQEAIASYKNSLAYREDACKFVAGNISRLDCLHYLYVYIRSDDIKKYPAVRIFYNDFLTEGNKEYREKCGK